MLEFMEKGCNKASGIEKLAQYLGIRREKIIAIGDAGNDQICGVWRGNGKCCR
jgi:hypothetical protein